MTQFLPGIPSSKLVEAHGSYATAHCLDCENEYSMEWMKVKILTPEPEEPVPKCDCGGIVKPDITFFGVRGAAQLPLQSTQPIGRSLDGTACQCLPLSSVLLSSLPIAQERLPARYAALHRPDIEAADLVLVIGTSLQVFPMSNLPRMCGPGVPRVLVNMEKVGAGLDDDGIGQCFYFDDVSKTTFDQRQCTRLLSPFCTFLSLTRVCLCLC